MGKSSTAWLTVLLMAAMGRQAAAQPVRTDWRRIGNAAMDLDLAGPATGAVERTWYSAGGTSLFARTASGLTLVTTDFETWKRTEDAPQSLLPQPVTERLPEPGKQARLAAAGDGRIYAAGENAWRSDDGGRNWRNLTAYRGLSILGESLLDIAVSPTNGDEVVVAGRMGIWRSLDGGLSWNSLNAGLPGLPVARLIAPPRDTRGARIQVQAGSREMELEWAPGEKLAWRPAAEPPFAAEAALKRELSERLGIGITAVARTGAYIYAGSVDGRLLVSADEGRNFPFVAGQEGAGRVEAIFVDPSEPRRALAALAEREGQAAAPRVVRTLNGGLFWDDISGDLPPGGAHGIAADVATGAIYVAADAGLFLTYSDLYALAPATPWIRISAALPAAAASDVKLDEAGNQLYVALRGFGVYATLAPHRARSPKLVSAADLAMRAAAPGALLSLVGSAVSAARTGDRNMPVLAADPSESQIQVPFEVEGRTLNLLLENGDVAMRMGLPLASAAPAIFVDRDGSPMLLDADSGVLLDAMNPARSGARIQVLATGLGRVRPDWPTGLAAPLDSPPQVVARVRAYVDRVQVEVTRATLAPGYIGFYVVELRLPEIVNYGPVELYLESDNNLSNRVRLYIEP